MDAFERKRRPLIGTLSPGPFRSHRRSRLPLPYVVAARKARIVNAMKHRPSDQPVTIILDSLERLGNCIDTNPRTLSLANWLSSRHLIHLQMPVKYHVPDCAAGAVSNGVLGVSLAWRQDLRTLFGSQGYLYASSANISGETPAATAKQLELAFGTAFPTLEDEPECPGQSEAKSGVIVRVFGNAEVKLIRPGAQNESRGETGDVHLKKLYAEWDAMIDPDVIHAPG